MIYHEKSFRINLEHHLIRNASVRMSPNSHIELSKIRTFSKRNGHCFHDSICLSNSQISYLCNITACRQRRDRGCRRVWRGRFWPERWRGKKNSPQRHWDHWDFLIGLSLCSLCWVFRVPAGSMPKSPSRRFLSRAIDSPQKTTIFFWNQRPIGSFSQRPVKDRRLLDISFEIIYERPILRWVL